MFYKINSVHVVAEVFEGDLVLVNLDSGTYFSAQGAGPGIWDALNAGASTEAIFESLKDTPERQKAAQMFVAALVENKLVIAADGSEGAVEVTRELADAGLASLEVYSDMQDLLLLDPIHEVDQRGWPVAKAE